MMQLPAIKMETLSTSECRSTHADFETFSHKIHGKDRIRKYTFAMKTPYQKVNLK